MINSLPGEEWKPVPEWEDVYLVSNFGRVYSLRAGKLVKLGQNKKGGGGYLRLNANVNKGKVHIQKNIYVHRLVAQLFVPNPDGKPEVNHLDENVSNNVWTNLEWVTHQENIIWSTSKKRKARRL